MYLYDNKGNYRMSTFFDIEFLEEMKKYKWCVHKGKRTYYARVGKTGLYLHQLICPCKKGFEPDHIDRDGLNNRKSNLRKVTSRGNSENRRTNVSGYVGVSWNKENKNWRSRIRVKDKIINLGSFDDKLDAFNVRQIFKQEHNLK